MPQQSLDIKNQLYSLCREYVAKRIAFAKTSLSNAQEECDEEIESKTANVHESGRSMTQIEKEKSARLLVEARNLEKILDHINPDKVNTQVKLGSLVTTSEGTFFIAIGIGKVQYNNMDFYIISPHSPLGQKLLGHQQNEEISFLNRTYLIKEII